MSERSVRPKRPSGVTLVELLIALVITGIAFFGLAVPFFSERLFWRWGEDQAEAQRDAQLALRAVAWQGRGSSGYTVSAGGQQISFDVVCPGADAVPGTEDDFPGSRQFSLAGSAFQMLDGCSGSTVVLIDGVRSQVAQLVFAPVIANRLVSVRMEVVHEGLRNELLETEIFLRNGV